MAFLSSFDVSFFSPQSPPPPNISFPSVDLYALKCSWLHVTDVEEMASERGEGTAKIRNRGKCTLMCKWDVCVSLANRPGGMWKQGVSNLFLTCFFSLPSLLMFIFMRWFVPGDFFSFSSWYVCVCVCFSDCECCGDFGALTTWMVVESCVGVRELAVSMVFC